jgi:hypothetical protein
LKFGRLNRAIDDDRILSTFLALYTQILNYTALLIHITFYSIAQVFDYFAQSILAGTRTPDVEHKEKVKRGKELELITVKVFGGAIDSGLEYLMRRNVQKAKEILDKILYVSYDRFSSPFSRYSMRHLDAFRRTTPVSQSSSESRQHQQAHPPQQQQPQQQQQQQQQHETPQMSAQHSGSKNEKLSAGGSISPPPAHVEKSSSPL